MVGSSRSNIEVRLKKQKRSSDEPSRFAGYYNSIVALIFTHLLSSDLGYPPVRGIRKVLPKTKEGFCDGFVTDCRKLQTQSRF